jgi:hypothetical protein
VKQRHGAKHLFWRGVVASVGNLAMATGLYPVVPHLGMMALRRRSGARAPAGQLRALAAEWAVAVALSAARPVGFFGLPAGARALPQPRPVIVVHGYAMNRANFLPLAGRLARAGFGPVLGFEYWTLGKASSAARRLGQYVERVCEVSGVERLDVIGHSMGGVVGRYLVTLGGGAPRVRNLITIGSPHGGSDYSGFGFGRPTSELLPGSNLLQRLEAAPLPAATRITAIWSRNDALVPASRNARLRGCDEIVYDDLGHLSMLISRRVTRDILEILSS